MDRLVRLKFAELETLIDAAQETADSAVSAALGLTSNTPQPAGVAAVGTDPGAAHGDHVHAAQTTITGNAGTATLAAAATVLATPRAINGQNFDGSAAITVAAAAGTLTGATLAAGVTASSLTSVGTLGSLTVSGALTVDTTTLVADATNNRVGVGIASPGTTLDVVAAVAAQNGVVRLQSTQADAFNSVRFYDSAGTAKINMGWGNASVAAAYAGNAYADIASGAKYRLMSNSTIALDMASGGSCEFPVGLTLGGVAVLSQTNTVASITNKTFTSPTLNAGTMSGNWTWSTPSITGGATFNSTQTFAGQIASTNSQRWGQRATTATTVTMGTADFIFFCDSSSGAVTLNMTSLATSGAGRTIIVKNFTGANNVTVTRASTDTIDGATTYVVAPGAGVVICGQGTASGLWNAVAKF